MATDLRPTRARVLSRFALVIGAASLLVAAGVVALVMSLGAGGSDDGASPLEDDPGLLHVHGLGVNPADGFVFAATHTGVFRISEAGRAERIAGRFQDTMGFTVIGPDHFLASGHPDLREGGPPLLGLIESTDAAETWDRRSLHGEADLHAIVAAHDQLYAADATGRRVLVSSDGGGSWEERSTAELAALAVDPEDPQHILGLTYESQLTTSPDGGRTWSPLPSPPFVAVGWTRRAGLFGLASDGSLHTSTGGGTKWSESSALSRPGEALLVTDDALYAAAEGGFILVSSDSGRTWQSVVAPRATGRVLRRRRGLDRSTYSL